MAAQVPEVLIQMGQMSRDFSIFYPSRCRGDRQTKKPTQYLWQRMMTRQSTKKRGAYQSSLQHNYLFTSIGIKNQQSAPSVDELLEAFPSDDGNTVAFAANDGAILPFAWGKRGWDLAQSLGQCAFCCS